MRGWKRDEVRELNEVGTGERRREAENWRKKSARGGGGRKAIKEGVLRLKVKFPHKEKNSGYYHDMHDTLQLWYFHQSLSRNAQHPPTPPLPIPLSAISRFLQ